MHVKNECDLVVFLKKTPKQLLNILVYHLFIKTHSSTTERVKLFFKYQKGSNILYSKNLGLAFPVNGFLWVLIFLFPLKELCDETELEYFDKNEQLLEKIRTSPGFQMFKMFL